MYIQKLSITVFGYNKVKFKLAKSYSILNTNTFTFWKKGKKDIFRNYKNFYKPRLFYGFELYFFFG